MIDCCNCLGNCVLPTRNRGLRHLATVFMGLVLILWWSVVGPSVVSQAGKKAQTCVLNLGFPWLRFLMMVVELALLGSGEGERWLENFGFVLDLNKSSFISWTLIPF